MMHAVADSEFVTPKTASLADTSGYELNPRAIRDAHTSGLHARSAIPYSNRRPVQCRPFAIPRSSLSVCGAYAVDPSRTDLQEVLPLDAAVAALRHLRHAGR